MSAALDWQALYEILAEADAAFAAGDLKGDEVERILAGALSLSKEVPETRIERPSEEQRW